MNALRLLVLAGEIDSLVAQIRLRTPLQGLAARTGMQVVWRSFHQATHRELAESDVMIVQRAFSMRVARLQRQMQRRGGAVIYEIDDLLTELPAHVSNHGHVLVRREALWACMRQADLVTVSTAQLGRTLGLPQWQVVPNAALPLGDAALPPLQPQRPVTLILASMEALVPGALHQALLGLRPETARIVAAGPAALSLAQAGVAIEARPLMPREHFIAWVRELPNPVAVIPLEDSRFASCKSPIKWFEYAEAGVPVLCSDVSPYREVVEHGRTGWLVAQDCRAWRLALDTVIGSGLLRQQVAQAAREVVRACHNMTQMEAAWQHAILRAQRTRGQAPGEEAGSALRWRDAAASLADDLLQPLRRFNRARLSRRHHR